MFLRTPFWQSVALLLLIFSLPSLPLSAGCTSSRMIVPVESQRPRLACPPYPAVPRLENYDVPTPADRIEIGEYLLESWHVAICRGDTIESYEKWSDGKGK